MKEPAAADKTPPAATRHVYGPRALATVLPPLLRPAFRQRSPASAQVFTDWTAIVGARLAGCTAPRKLAAGTLTIACAGPVALELQHLGEALRERINTALGATVVQRLRFVQDATLIPTTSPPPPLERGPEPALPGVPEGPLRDALVALGRAIASRR
jgi:hypothetical protein